MRRGSTAAVPREVEDLQQRLEHWRSTHKRRGRLPEALWVEAAALARQHGVYVRDPELVTAAYCCAPRFGVAAGVALAVPIAASSDFLYLGSLR